MTAASLSVVAWRQLVTVAQNTEALFQAFLTIVDVTPRQHDVTVVKIQGFSEALDGFRDVTAFTGLAS